MPPFFSIVAVNYNGLRFLDRFVGSLRAQSFGDYELTVVDNVSTDGSRDWLASRRGAFDVVLSERNGGYAPALNLGARSAQGEWLILSNEDIYVAPDCLENLHRAIQAEPDVDLLAVCAVRASEPSRLDTAGHVVYPDGLTRGRGIGRPRVDYARREEVFGGSGAFMACRRGVWERLGGMDADFTTYCEEADFTWRARLQGARCLYVPDALVEHHFSSAYGRVSATKLYLVERNRLWLALKNLPAPLLLASPVWTAWRYAWAAAGLQRGKGFAAEFAGGKRAGVQTLLRAYVDAARALPKTLAKRRAIQRTRRASVGEIAGWLQRFGVSAKNVMWEL